MTVKSQDGDVQAGSNARVRAPSFSIPVDLGLSIIDELEQNGNASSLNAAKLRLILSGHASPAEPIDDEAAVVRWLSRSYVQRSDDRQKAMGLQYTEAETHDLAASFFRKYLHPLQVKLALLEAGLTDGANHAK